MRHTPYVMRARLTHKPCAAPRVSYKGFPVCHTAKTGRVDKNIMEHKKINIGVIGLGRMGKKHLSALSQSEDWEVKTVCDINEQRREQVKEIVPEAVFTVHEDDIFGDPDIDAVALCALADVRLEQIEKAVKAQKHIIAEKPVAASLEDEWRAVELVEQSAVISTVNMYLNNAWYTNEMKRFVKSGEIGELAIIRICHMTPGLAPGEGHEFEGPSFHDCGMHYVNIARWFAESEYKTGHAQAIRMWGYKDPWWLTCHGTFENGVVFEITQGFVYGQLSKDQTHNSTMELIGSKGVVRETHDFKTAVVDERGVSITRRIERPYGDKNIGKLYDEMAASIHSGRRNSALPSFRESAIASQFAWEMLDDVRHNDLPVKGTPEELEAIHRRRAEMKNGYGLLR